MPIPSALYKNLSKDERRRLWADYRVWIVEGAKHQGWINQTILSLGAALLGGALILAVYATSWPFVVASAVVGAFIIFFGGRRAMRNEAQWRANNPFDTSKYQVSSDDGDRNR